MDRQTASKYKKEILAFADGEQIQLRSAGAQSAWTDIQPQQSLLWDKSFEYRIKPKPAWRPWKPSECPKVFVVAPKKDPNADGGWQAAEKCSSDPDSVIVLDGYEVSRQLRTTGSYRFREGLQIDHQHITLQTLFDQFVQILPDGSHQPCGILDTNPSA